MPILSADAAFESITKARCVKISDHMHRVEIGSLTVAFIDQDESGFKIRTILSNPRFKEPFYKSVYAAFEEVRKMVNFC